LSNSRKQQVERWLAAMGIQAPTTISDPMALWHVQINYPPNSGHIMHVVCPKTMPEAVVIASKLTLGADLIDNFRALDPDAQDEFLWELRKTLNTPRVDFRLEGADGPMDCPTAIETSSVRYFDGVTLDSFARTVGCVFKTEVAANWVIFRHLGPKGYGSGDRFDFKRLGL
jgi:hypothetical protein